MVTREPAFGGMMHCATTRDLRVNRTLLYLGVDTSTESAVYRPWPLLAVFLLIITIAAAAETEVREYDVRPGAHPHDVAPAADNGKKNTTQRQKTHNKHKPQTRRTQHNPHGEAS